MTEDNACANSFQSSYEAPEKSDASLGPSALSELKGATAAASPCDELKNSVSSLLGSGGAGESQVIGLRS
jgi:hypothetical protein